MSRRHWNDTAVQCSGGGTTGSAPGGQVTTSSGISCLKARSYLSSRASRSSPYSVPSRLASSKCDCSESGNTGDGVNKRGGSWAARKRYPSMSANGKQKHEKLEDPLEMLQELIRYESFALVIDLGRGRVT